MKKTVVGTRVTKWTSKTSGKEVRARILYCLVEKNGVNGHACEEVMCFGDLVDGLDNIKLNSNYDFDYEINGTRAFLTSVTPVK